MLAVETGCTSSSVESKGHWYAMAITALSAMSDASSM